MGEAGARAAAAGAAIDRILLSTVLLLLAGVMLSVATGVLVSRAVVRAEQTLRVTLASIGDAVIALPTRRAA